MFMGEHEMKKIIGALITATAISFAGAAHAGFVDASFGNTVTVALEDGTVLQQYFLDEDGTITISETGGETMSGTWEVNDEEICVTVGEQVSCNPTPDVAVGESWDVTTDDGNVLTISIVAGR